MSSERTNPVEELDQTRAETTRETEGTDDRDTAELIAELELTKEENRRLRESYVRARKTQYRRTALGLVGLGLLATAGAVVFPSVRTVLLALGATGLFSGLLTYYLTPERFVSAQVGVEIHAALASTREAIIGELGLENECVYVPVGESRVRLFVPQQRNWQIPNTEALDSVFVVPDTDAERGVSFEPSGHGLFEEFERALDGPLGNSVDELLAQLREGLIEQFEIVADIDVDSDTRNGRLSVSIEDDSSIYGSLDRFDHPASSFLAVGLARGLARPVRIETHENGTTVTFRWEPDAAS